LKFRQASGAAKEILLAFMLGFEASSGGAYVHAADGVFFFRRCHAVDETGVVHSCADVAAAEVALPKVYPKFLC
jgi:hypothetical protein